MGNKMEKTDHLGCSFEHASQRGRQRAGWNFGFGGTQMCPNRCLSHSRTWCVNGHLD